MLKIGQCCSTSFIPSTNEFICYLCYIVMPRRRKKPFEKIANRLNQHNHCIFEENVSFFPRATLLRHTFLCNLVCSKKIAKGTHHSNSSRKRKPCKRLSISCSIFYIVMLSRCHHYAEKATLRVTIMLHCNSHKINEWTTLGRCMLTTRVNRNFN